MTNNINQIKFLQNLKPGTLLLTKKAFKLRPSELSLMNDAQNDFLDEDSKTKGMPEVAIKPLMPLVFLKSKTHYFHLNDYDTTIIHRIYFLHGSKIVCMNYMDDYLLNPSLKEMLEIISTNNN